MTNIQELGLYPMSIILSFLTEEEGTSLLLCRKQWTRRWLPYFQVHDPMDQLVVLTNNNSNNRSRKRRHVYQVFPVQDAMVQLDRLNTRRWYKRRLPCQNTTTEEFAQQGASSIHHPEYYQYPPLLRFYPTLSNTTTMSKPFSFRAGTTILASYPRSGNSLLRNLLESATGYVTGSDTRPNRTLSVALAKDHDLVGEGVTPLSPPSWHHTVPIVKTHWPERLGYQRYRAKHVLMLVRNPWDALDSYWNLNLTNTHTRKVTEEVYDTHATFWESLVLHEIKVWLDFVQFWHAECERLELSIHWIRYEDMMLKPQTTLLDILEFTTTVLGENSGVSTNQAFWKDRVAWVMQNRHLHGYKSSSSSLASSANSSLQNSEVGDRSASRPLARRSPSSPYGRTLYRYSRDLLERMHQLDEHGWLKRLGYDVLEQGFPNNILELPPPPPTIRHEIGTTAASKGIIVNQASVELRPPQSIFGRNMRNWRRQYTNDDLEPFPTR